jgi:uncharacterized protein YwqG
MSIYVPLLPPLIQEFFREDDRELLIVVLFCTNGRHHRFTIKVFKGEEINDLVMAPDVELDGDCFNEPRLVVDWREGVSYVNKTVLDELKIEGLHYKASQVFADWIEMELGGEVEAPYAGGFPKYWNSTERPTETSKVLFTIKESEVATGEWGDCGIAHIWMETGENYGKFSATFSAT